MQKCPCDYKTRQGIKGQKLSVAPFGVPYQRTVDLRVPHVLTAEICQ
jgi:hypothetical protein